MDAATRTYARLRRSEIIRERTKPRQGPQLPITHEQMVAEIESAVAFFQRGSLGGAFPRVRRTPTDTPSALVTA